MFKINIIKKIILNYFNKKLVLYLTILKAIFNLINKFIETDYLFQLKDGSISLININSSDFAVNWFPFKYRYIFVLIETKNAN